MADAALPPILAQLQSDVERILADYATLNGLAAPQAEKLAYGARMLGEQASVLREQCDAYFARWATPRPALPAPILLDIADVGIVRHRQSVTQQEVSLYYRGDCLGRFGDDVRYNAMAMRYEGLPDTHWIGVVATVLRARRIVAVEDAATA